MVGGLGWPFAFPGDLNPLELDVERGPGMAAWEQTCAALMSHVRRWGLATASVETGATILGTG